MSPSSGSCLSCLQTEDIFSIFEVHNCEGIGEIEDSATMLKNCFDIKIPPDSGLDAICGTCMLKLRDAYCFKLEIVKIIKETNKQTYSHLEYLDNIQSDPELPDKENYLNDYDSDFKLDPETGHFRYVVNKNIDNVLNKDNVQNEDNVQYEEIFLFDNVPEKAIQRNVINVQSVKKVYFDNSEANKVTTSNILIDSPSTKDKEKEVNTLKEEKKCHLDKELDDNVHKKDANVHNGSKVAENLVKEYKITVPKSILKKKSSISETEDRSVDVEIGTPTKKSKKSVTFKEDVETNVSKKKPVTEKLYSLKPDQTDCSVCTETFHTTKKLIEHMNIHFPNEICEQCGRGFVCKKSLKRHLTTHLKGPFPCSVCGQIFSKLNTRSAHIWRVHQTLEPYVCSECGARFKTFHKRLNHLQNVHGRTEPKYPCPHCDNKYFDAGTRSQHIRLTHLQERRYQCSKCPRVFPRRREVLSHLASCHGIGEKRHQCQVCQKSFYRSTTLRYHMKTHEKAEKKQFQCTICDANFTYKAVFKCHMKSHELEDVIMCYRAV